MTYERDGVNEDGYPMDRPLELRDLTVACNTCRHRFVGRCGCDALPDGNIPNAILSARHQHRTPYPGDHGVQYSAIPASDW